MTANVGPSGYEGRFRLTRMHHPAHHVPDVDEAEVFLKRIFGATSSSIAVVLDSVARVQPYWPRNYSIYTPIRDVFFDSIDPRRFDIGDGNLRFTPVDTPHLEDFGFSVEGMTALFRHLKHHGYSATNSLLEPVEGDDPPTQPNDPAPFNLLPDNAGRRYRFYPDEGVFPIDPRTQPGWVLPPVDDSDPLGLDRCSHHTVVTTDRSRGLRLFELLGAEVIGEGRDELRGLTSTYVHIADSTIQFGVADEGSDAHADSQANLPNDTYHAITWRVVDLDRAVSHLESEGVRIARRSDDTVITDPATSLGIPWGFSTSFAAGDPRSGQGQET